MQLPLLDENAQFSCGGCTSCCDQPWRTMIETDKAHALDRHDWSGYPQLAGRRFYHAPADGRDGFYDLSKGEGTRCLFLDTDGRCIIHKELGPEAKPAMCRQFPYLSSRTWTDDRVALNYGCPTVQQRQGKSLADQQDEIREVTMMPARPHKGAGVRVPLDTVTTVSHEEYETLLDGALEIFDENRDGDIWARFEALIARLISMRESASCPAKDSDGVVDDQAKATMWDHPSAAPMPARMLFAATLYPDTLPANRTGRVGLLKRLLLMPRWMSLAKMTGGYASRILGRNVSIDAVMNHPIDGEIDPAATRLLLRYFRSRFWQRWIVGTRLPIIAGVHQHLLDFNAIVFLARAEAQHRKESRWSEALVRKALTGVEFHLANQSRLYEQTLRGWFKTQLCNPHLAMQSLRWMSPRAGAANAQRLISSPR